MKKTTSKKEERDDNIYIKVKQGNRTRYIPYGIRCGENYLPDGIWYVRHKEYSVGTTNADNYIPSLFKVGDAERYVDIPTLCAMENYKDYILSSDAFREFADKGYYTINDLASKIISLVLELNEEYKRKESSKTDKQINRKKGR